MSANSFYIPINEDGYLLENELPMKDQKLAVQLLSEIALNKNGILLLNSTSNEGVERQPEEQVTYLEAFDAPLIAKEVTKISSYEWKINTSYGFETTFDPKTLCADEWDRFHGLTNQGVPFVLSSKAQMLFFDNLDEFDDFSITIDGHKIEIPSYFESFPDVDEKDFWDSLYKQKTPPGWELNEANPILVKMLPLLKLPKQRILVLGCGSGCDAAYLAQQGHLVTGVDISATAIEQAQRKHGAISSLKFIQADAFHLGSEYDAQYDLIFEHTFFCAIKPSRRNELIQNWKRLLVPEGHLFGIFFTMKRTHRPPFGASEWEIRERLKKHFYFLYWNRWRESTPGREACELFVYAKIKTFR